MTGVLGEFTQYLQVQRPRGALAAAVDCVVERQSGHGPPGRVTAFGVSVEHGCDGVGTGEGERLVGVFAMPISRYERPVTAWSNHTPST